MMRLRPLFESRGTVVGIGVALGNGPNQVEMPPSRFRRRISSSTRQDGKVRDFATR